jgi:hypothetical protein
MKKALLTALGLSIAGLAMADISVEFKNTTGYLKPGFTSPTGGGVLDTGVFVQLVWKQDNVGYQTDDLALSLVNPGEVILLSGLADNDRGRFNFGSAIYGNSIIDAALGGSNDINSGHFYARIFETAAPTVGSYFIELGIQNPTLKAYDASNPLDTSTSYTDNMGDLALWTSVDAQNTQVIPEPGTIGMMGIAGLGMYLARKKSRR